MSLYAGRLLRVGVAAGLTAFLLWQSDSRAVASSLSRAAAGPLVVAVLLVLVDRTLMAYRWLALLCIVEPRNRPALGEVIRIFFVSTFVGTFLPASVGGDAVRAYSLSRQGVSGPEAVASVFMDRMLGVLSILVLAVAGLLVATRLLEHPAVQAGLATAAIACAGTLAVVFHDRSAALARACLAAVPIDVVRRIGGQLVASVQRYAAFHRELALVLVASVAVQVLRVVQAYYLGLALGIHAGLAAYFALVPLILLVMLLPITMNGLGTSQAAFVWFFATVGVASADAFALSVLFVALGIVGNLPGGLLYITGGMPTASGGQPTAAEHASWPPRRG